MDKIVNCIEHFSSYFVNYFIYFIKNNIPNIIKISTIIQAYPIIAFLKLLI